MNGTNKGKNGIKTRNETSFHKNSLVGISAPRQSSTLLNKEREKNDNYLK